jgi:RNA polymerase sigma-70 factor, ECF subfamily
VRVEREVQDRLHAKVCRGDPTASLRIFEALLDPLIKALRSRWPDSREAERVRDAAIDSIMNYLGAPQKYDPSKASLMSYLQMDASGDLINGYPRLKRERENRTDSDVELGDLLRNSSVDEYPSDRDQAEMSLAEVREALPDKKDQRAVLLLIEGERSTEAFAEVWGLQKLPPDDRFAEVKRNKDRIKARLRRLKERHD